MGKRTKMVPIPQLQRTVIRHRGAHDTLLRGC